MKDKYSIQFMLSKTEKTNPIIFNEKSNFLYKHSNEICNSESTINKNGFFKAVQHGLTNIRDLTIKMNNELSTNQYEGLQTNADFNSKEREKLKDKDGSEIFHFFNKIFKTKGFTMRSQRTRYTIKEPKSFTINPQISTKHSLTKLVDHSLTKLNFLSTNKFLNSLSTKSEKKISHSIEHHPKTLSDDPQKYNVILKLIKKKEIENEALKEFNNKPKSIKGSQSMPLLQMFNKTRNAANKTNKFNQKSSSSFRQFKNLNKSVDFSVSCNKNDSSNKILNNVDIENSNKINMFLTGATIKAEKKKLRKESSLYMDRYDIERDKNINGLKRKINSMILTPDQEKTVIFYDKIRDRSNPIANINRYGRNEIKGVQAILANNKKVKIHEELMKTYCKLNGSN